jgi:hypothetical protein
MTRLLSFFGGLSLLCLIGCLSGANDAPQHTSSNGTNSDGPTVADLNNRVTKSDAVELALNWFPEAKHGGFFAAKVHGLPPRWCDGRAELGCAGDGHLWTERHRFGRLDDNIIRDSGVSGVLWRPERGPSFAGHRNRIYRNEIVNSGGDAGVGIDIQGGVESIELIDNHLVESRGASTRIGLKLRAETKNIRLTDNRIEGFSQPVVDLRQTQAAKWELRPKGPRRICQDYLWLSAIRVGTQTSAAGR